MSQPRPSIGTRLRWARRTRGITGRELARRIDVSPATISQLENDNAHLTVERLEEIAVVLDMPAGAILTATAPREDSATRPSTTRSADSPTGRGNWRRYEPLAFDPILAAAVDELLEVGYHGTTMRRIAARSGVSVPAIYGHYESKQAILVRILDDALTDLEWRTAAAVAQGTDPSDRFCRAVENLALFHTYRRGLGFIAASEVRALVGGNREAITARRNRQQEIVDELVHEAVALGVFTTTIPDDAARVVVSMCAALPTWWRPFGRLSPEAVAAEYVDFALALVGYR